ncbi:YjcZ family sporulation protein [Neobacillus sp. LXY-4]
MGARGVDGGYGHGAGFALIVVLFILLVIVGSAYVGFGY